MQTLILLLLFLQQQEQTQRAAQTQRYHAKEAAQVIQYQTLIYIYQSLGGGHIGPD